MNHKFEDKDYPGGYNEVIPGHFFSNHNGIQLNEKQYHEALEALSAISVSEQQALNISNEIGATKAMRSHACIALNTYQTAMQGFIRYAQSIINQEKLKTCNNP